MATRKRNKVVWRDSRPAPQVAQPLFSVVCPTQADVDRVFRPRTAAELRARFHPKKKAAKRGK